MGQMPLLPMLMRGDIPPFFHYPLKSI
jgi:hypothetical protein